MSIFSNLGWDESVDLDIFVKLFGRSEREKTCFLLILIQVLSYVVAGFYNCKLPLNVLLYISIFVFRARAWLSKRSILSAEEGKSFMLKTYSIKVCLLLLSCQHHFYMKQGAKIMILYNLEIPIFWVYIKSRNWCLKNQKTKNLICY